MNNQVKHYFTQDFEAGGDVKIVDNSDITWEGHNHNIKTYQEYVAIILYFMN